MKNKDNLSLCPCDKQSDACYVQQVGGTDIKNKLCWTCGFLSNTLMKEGDKFLQEQLEILPQLYKDIIWKDKEDLCWMPSSINLPTQGMVFLDGKTVDEAGWSAVLATKIKEEEKHKFPIPNSQGKFYEYKMDMSTLKKFDRYNFIGALEYIGILPKDE